MKAIAVALLLLVPAFGIAGDAYFFRVVSTQTTHITNFDQPDSLSWSNSVVPAASQIEWTPDLRGLWLTNHFAAVQCTSAVTELEFPSVFSTGHPSTVLHQKLNAPVSGGGPQNYVDLDADGTWDVQFRYYILTNWDTYDEFVDVDADRPAIILSPYTNGQLISAVPTTAPDTWTVYQYSMNLAIRDVESPDPGFPRGPWAGVTNAYLPVRLSRPAGYHYGWIALQFDFQLMGGPTNWYLTNTEITDCGLNAVPGQPIRAGQK